MRRESILTAVEEYYSSRFAEHGASARGVDWNSEESQQLRFEQLAQLFRGEEARFSVNDLGCGYGAFATFLRRRGFEAAYTGYDLSQSMLEHARTTFAGEPDVQFKEGTELSLADYSVASGVFNVKLGFDDDAWRAYVDHMIADLAHASRKGFAFNMLTSYSDPDKRRSDLFYEDPRELFDVCKRSYSPHVALLHDYGLWEFTVIVRMSP
jgi:SAM-dependent methyltransferase